MDFNGLIVLSLLQAILSVVILSLCSGINITFLVLRQRNARTMADKNGLKVKSRSKKKAISDDESGLKDRLLPDPDDAEDETLSKLLGNQDGAGGDNNRYRSLSCSNCTENCSEVLYQEASSKSDVLLHQFQRL